MSHISNIGYVSKRSEHIRLSKHAKKRCQQRGGDEMHIPLIRMFGEMEHDGHGAIRHVMTKAAMSALYRTIGHTKKLEQLEGRYIVISAQDSTVITCGHLYQ